MKILNIINTGFYINGGLTTVALGIYRNLDHAKYQIEFAACNNLDEESIKIVLKEGIIYHKLPSRTKQIKKYKEELYKLVLDNSYDIVYIHGNSATMILETSTIRKIKNIRIIVHCHTSKSTHPLINNFFSFKFSSTYDYAIATSKEAGEFLFKKTGYTIMPNAISYEKFYYDETFRKTFRNIYNINKDEIVIGTVGKLNAGKNYKFMLQVFKKFNDKHKNSKLVIVGDGPLKSKIIKEINNLKLNDSVFLHGNSYEVNKIMSAFDVFLFTSKFEGFGLVLIEAQANGLPIVSSDSVPQSTKISPLIEYCSLQDNIDLWIKDIEEALSKGRIYDNRLIGNYFDSSNLSFNYQVKIFEEIVNDII